MTIYHLGQLAVLATAVVLILERLRRVLYQAPVDPTSLLKVLGCPSLDWDRVRQWARAAHPAWAAHLVAAACEARRSGQDPHAALDLSWMALKEEADKHLHVLRGLGSIASALGLLGVLVEFRDAMGPMANEEGRRLAIQHAITAMSIGLTTSTICVGALRILRRWLVELTGDLKRVSAGLNSALETSHSSPL